MSIEEKDFKLISAGYKDWDLYFKKGDKWVVAGYGMRMESCLRVIIQNRLKHKQEVYTLKEYFDAYVKEKAEFHELLNKIEGG